MKYNEDLSVISNEQLNANCFMLRLKSPTDLRQANIQPGQFVNVWVKDVAERILRRPISIHDVDLVNNEIRLIVQIIGQSTKKLSLIKPCQSVSVTFPLGNCFPQKETKPLLIGGGVGTAPLFYLAKAYNNIGIRPKILIGARTKEQLFLIDKYKQVSDVSIATEDGSIGEKGLVTSHSVLKEQFSAFITCGPEPMMRAINNVARQKNIPCYASLENRMACGIGACLCCVTETANEGNQCVCTSGPIFNTNNLNW